ncbi:MAG: hypothetical protein ACLUR5_10045 [Eubacterium ventriosum]
MQPSMMLPVPAVALTGIIKVGYGRCPCLWHLSYFLLADGRCVSLLKILYTNECIYDCKYCINRKSNDVT